MKMHRQGEIQIKPLDRLPTWATKVKKDGVIREGETTGHIHKVEGDAVLYEYQGTMYLHIGDKGGTITHQEHKPIVLDKGDYEIGIQREYDEDKFRQVVD